MRWWIRSSAWSQGLAVERHLHQTRPDRTSIIAKSRRWAWYLMEQHLLTSIHQRQLYHVWSFEAGLELTSVVNHSQHWLRLTGRVCFCENSLCQALRARSHWQSKPCRTRAQLAPHSAIPLLVSLLQYEQDFRHTYGTRLHHHRASVYEKLGLIWVSTIRHSEHDYVCFRVYSHLAHLGHLFQIKP